jgi:hypothetical protein
MQYDYDAMLTAIVYHQVKHFDLFRFQVWDWHYHRFLGLSILFLPVSLCAIGLRRVLRTCSKQAVL